MWRAEADTGAAQMLQLQTRLGNTARIETFLAEQPAEGNYAAADNEAIVRAAALLQRRRATDLLVRILRRNTTTKMGACSDLALRCVLAPTGAVGDPVALGEALIEGLPGDPAKPTGLQTWERLPQPLPAAVVDLLSALSRIDAALALRAIEHLLAWPATYPMDTVLVPAALVFAATADTTAWPAIDRQRHACLAHLQARIDLPLEAPGDWTRPNPMTCNCADCRDLAAFLVDPKQKEWRFRAIQHRRTHLEGSVRQAVCDLDLATEKRGSPHTLIATKNQASYQRRVKERRQDLEQVAALTP
jgi:hypothetical protein